MDPNQKCQNTCLAAGIFKIFVWFCFITQDPTFFFFHSYNTTEIVLCSVEFEFEYRFKDCSVFSRWASHVRRMLGLHFATRDVTTLKCYKMKWTNDIKIKWNPSGRSKTIGVCACERRARGTFRARVRKIRWWRANFVRVHTQRMSSCLSRRISALFSSGFTTI